MADLSKEYATALFSLAREKGLVENFKAELDDIKSALCENEDYLLILRSPALSLGARLDLIDSAFGKDTHEYIISFLKLICENGDIDCLISCLEEFFSLCKELENRIVAKVYYVKEPSSAQKERLIKKLANMTGKEIDVIYIEDNSLIGGIKIELDDKIIDGSISARLTNIKGVIG